MATASDERGVKKPKSPKLELKVGRQVRLAALKGIVTYTSIQTPIAVCQPVKAAVSPIYLSALPPCISITACSHILTYLLITSQHVNIFSGRVMKLEPRSQTLIAVCSAAVINISNTSYLTEIYYFLCSDL